MRIGVRAHDFGKLPIEVLAEKIGEKRFSSVQLALVKALEGINTDTGCLSPGLAGHIRKTMDKNGICIAVLGCYFNAIDPNLEDRRKGIARFKEHIRFARDFGCSIVATETGSMNADWSFHPGNHSEEAFEMLLETVAELVEEAERFGVFAGIEGVEQHVLHSPKKIKRMLDIINSGNLQIVFDPVNLLSPENYREQDRVLQESFDLFGDRIVAVHAKDFIAANGEIRTVQIGKGILDYKLLMSLLKSRKPYVDVLMEGLDPDTSAEVMAYLNSF